MTEALWTGKITRMDVARGPYDGPIGWLSFVLFWFLVAGLSTDLLVPRPERVFSGWWILIPLLIAPVSALAHFVRRRPEADVTAGPEGLSIRSWLSSSSVPRKEIVSGHVRPCPSGAEVELRLVDRSILHLGFDEMGDAEALVEALGLDAASRPATLSLGEVGERYLRAALIALGHVLCSVVVYAPRMPAPGSSTVPEVLAHVAFLALVSYLLVRVMRFPEVTVGLDAVVVKGPFRRRVIPWSRIDRIDTAAEGVTLVLAPPPGSAPGAGSKLVRLRSPGTAVPGRALASRLEEAHRLRALVVEDQVASRLARAGRPLKDWRAAVVSLLQGQTGVYRSAAVRVEALRAIAESPAAPAEQRLAAAMAIGAAGDGAARASVRISAGGVVSRRLRVALREALRPDPDETAIEEALAEAEAESAEARS